jgi:hypothetical protein
VRKRKVRLHSQFPQLSTKSISDISEYESEEEDDANTGNERSEASKHAYRDETWSQKCFTYDPKPQAFVRRRGTQQFFHYMPTILQLFELFWPFNLLWKIVIETNHYAMKLLELKEIQGGVKMGDFDNCKIENIHGNSHIHGHEKTTKL